MFRNAPRVSVTWIAELYSTEHTEHYRTSSHSWQLCMLVHICPLFAAEMFLPPAAALAGNVKSKQIKEIG